MILLAPAYAEFQAWGLAVLAWLGVALLTLGCWVLLLVARAVRRVPVVLDRVESILDQVVEETRDMDGLGKHIHDAGATVQEMVADLARVSGAVARTTTKVEERIAEPVLDGVVHGGRHLGQVIRVAAAAGSAALVSLVSRLRGRGPAKLS